VRTRTLQLASLLLSNPILHSCTIQVPFSAAAALATPTPIHRSDILMDTLALSSESCKSVATRLFSLLGKAKSVPGAADILLLHELDLLLGSADVLFLLLLCCQLAVAIGTVAGRVSVATGCLSIAARLRVVATGLRRLLLALGRVAKEIVAVGICVCRGGAS
jgi:hypothetical protein